MNKVNVESVTLKDLFSRPLRIPKYQRGYCWEKNHVESLLESLWYAEKSKTYHLGTVILHKHSIQEKEDYNIVDGQQRLLTLSILIYCLEKDKTVPSKFSLPLLTSQTGDPDVIKHIIDNRDIISNWIFCHNKPASLEEFIQDKLTFTSVTIYADKNDENVDDRDECDPALPLAWTFFNSVNSGGKPLSDFDLLKAHHLRHLSIINDDSLIQYKASKWDSNGEQQVHFFSSTNLYEASLAHTFYLIRSWLKNRPICISELPADSRYCILQHYSALQSFPDAGGAMKGLTGGIIGGKQFFDWTEYWVWQFNRFCDNPVIKMLMNMPWAPAQKHLRIIANALLFYYFSKFGDVYLADACIFILYRIGRLRNKTAKSKGAWYGNGYDEKCVPHTISALEESPSPEFFFKYCQLPSNRYVRYYNLKNIDQNQDTVLLRKFNLGPDWWKRFLVLASSSVVQTPMKEDSIWIPDIPQYHIGDSICFKKEIAELLNEVAHDFKWEFDANTLKLSYKENA